MNRMKTVVTALGATALTLSVTACGGDDDDLSDYCEQGESLAESFAPETFLEDPAQLAELATAAQEMADTAPEEVAADWEVAADGFAMIAEVDLTDPEALADLDFDQAAFEDALDRIDQHSEEACE